MKLKLPKWLQHLVDKHQETKFVKGCFDLILDKQSQCHCDQDFYSRTLKNLPNNLHELPDTKTKVPGLPVYNAKTSQLYWFYVQLDKYNQILSCKLIDKTYAPTWDANMIEERLMHLYKAHQTAANKDFIANVDGNKQVVNFIVKPGYPIFTKSRQDMSKTDVQQTESFAIARLINDSNKFYTKSIVIVQDDEIGCCESCQETVVCDIDWALKMIENSKNIQVNVYVVNFVWPSIESELFKKQIQLIETADCVTWLWYDIREHMMPQLDKVKWSKSQQLSIWTQANANTVELQLREHMLSNMSYTVQHLELQMLPKWFWSKENGYSADNELNLGRAEFADGKPQIVFPICKWRDMSTERQQAIEQLVMNENVHVSAVGSLDDMPEELQQRIMYFGTIKTPNMQIFMSKFDATIVIDERSSVNAEAMTFRGIEAMLANIPVLYIKNMSTITNDKFKPFDSIDEAISWLNYARSKKIVLSRHLAKQRKAMQIWSEQLYEQMQNFL